MGDNQNPKQKEQLASFGLILVENQFLILLVILEYL